MADALRNRGIRVIQVEEYRPDDYGKPDAIILSNPHLRPEMLQNIAETYSAGDVPVLVDLDMDYENMPVHHPDYPLRGLGRLANRRAFTSSLLMANRITVPSVVMAESLRERGYRVEVVPDGWNADHSFLNRSASNRSGVHIGLSGITGVLEDFVLVRRVLIRLLKEFENATVVIIGNTNIYQALESVPDRQRLFLPHNLLKQSTAELHPVDILLVPCCNHPFNRSRSDAVLVEAGALAIPWVASPMPAFVDWHAGGLFAEPAEEWHTLLRQLLLDESLRAALGKDGYRAAGAREAHVIGTTWVQIFERLKLEASRLTKAGQSFPG
jgi:hypothetical protein